MFNRMFRTELDEFDEHLVTKRKEDVDASRRTDRRPAPTGPPAVPAGDQSRKFSNCSGMPKSSALHLAITSWRSSRFLPVTRS